MFGSVSSIINRSKRGIAIAIESIRFALRNLDIVFTYLLGAMTSAALAIGSAALIWIFGVGTASISISVSQAFFITAVLGTAGIYVFTMFFWHGVAVHLIGSRMLGDELRIRTAVTDVLNRPGVLVKWALITAIVKMLSVLSDSDDAKNKSVFRFIPKISILSVYRTATFFIHPTLIFYSSDDTKEEISKALSIYATRIVEVLAMKAAMTIFTAVLITGGIALIVSSIIIVPFLTLNIDAFNGAIVQVFAATPILAVAAILFLAMVGWSLDKLIFDIGKTAVYLDSEAPIDDLTGFDQTVIHPDESFDREEIFKSNVPQAIINRLQTWSGDGTFCHRL